MHLNVNVKKTCVQYGSVLALFAMLAGCSRGCGNPAPNGGAGARTEKIELHSGASVFSFDYQKVTELLIVKSDPETGDRWAAHLTRPSLKSDAWEIQNAGNGTVPLNTQADEYFILHLLDTLRTLHAEQTEVPGAHESLGLAPPRFALQWRCEGKEYEVRFGLPAKKGETLYAWVPNEPAFTASGATLTMLDYLKSFTSLRQKNWIGIAADDIDEIEVGVPSKSGKALFYAQREGADWTGRDHKPLSKNIDVGAWLERLTHQRVKEFIDDPARANTLEAAVRHLPLRKATLKDRHGRSVELWLAHADGQAKSQWIALSSARTNGVFEVFPESAQALEPPKAGLSPR